MLFKHFQPESTPKYLASKWIHLPFLVTRSDLEGFFQDVVLVKSSGVYDEQAIVVSKEQFLQNWDRYLSDLSALPIQDAIYKPLFSLFCTSTPQTIGMVEVGQGLVSATQLAPNIIFQAHRFHYSSFDKQFRRQVFGPETISWGLQASFPTLVQDPKTRAVTKALLDPEIANRPLWMRFQKWLKSITIPATIQTPDGVKTVPFRISRDLKGFHHFEMAQRGLTWSQ